MDDVETVVADPPISGEPPTLEETRKALEQLKDRKAPGTCCVFAEMLEVGGESALKGLHRLLCSVWNTSVILIDWKRGIVSPSGMARVTSGSATTTGV